MDTERVRRFWDASSRKAGVGTHSDPNITELERWFTVRFGLDGAKPRSLLDVGCGEGGKTRFLSRFAKHAVGIDYSEGMIKRAREHQDEGVAFKVGDVVKRPHLGFVPDVIVSCRCLINMGDEKSVMRALDWFFDILPRRGRLILLEASRQGHDNLNDLRHRLGLPKIETVWYNINLEEPRIEAWFKGRFEILHKTRFGFYYVITRGFSPAILLPKPPNPSSRVNSLACEMQKEAGIGVLEDYGRHYCVSLRKM